MKPLEPGKHYHIFNRANGSEKLFRNPDNYEFFLKKYRKHISPICDTLCYCLMPNHFHLLVRIKDENEIRQLDNFGDTQKMHWFISKQFSNLFSSYTQAFNKQKGRKGSLFMRAFKRKSIDDENYLRTLILYIHFNPVEAGFSKTPMDWRYSSYPALISNKPTLLERKEVLSYFDGVENFILIHDQS